ncbi:MAG: hypothetical protein ACRC9R_04060 [Enterovibrio sp.]
MKSSTRYIYKITLCPEQKLLQLGLCAIQTVNFCIEIHSFALLVLEQVNWPI